MTSRVRLRPFVAADVDRLHQLLAVPDVLRYFPTPGPPPLEHVREVIARQLQHWVDRGYGWWALELRAGRCFAGWSGLQFLPDTEEIEVAYLLGRPFWGRGLATEAAHASLQYGFDRLSLPEVVGIVHPANAASRRVLEKLGMKLTRQATYFGMDCCRYQLDRAAFDSTARSLFPSVRLPAGPRRR